MIYKILSYIPGLRALILPTKADIPLNPEAFQKKKNNSGGSQDSFGSFYGKNGHYTGHKALNGMFTDHKGDYIGKVNKDGTFHDRFGAYAGRINQHGHLSGKDGNFLGRLAKSGAVSGKMGQYLGQVPPGNEAAAFQLVFNQHKIEQQAMPAPVLCISASSGTGKTTLLKKLIPLLKTRNIRVGLIKHTHHKMDVDTKGKDSYELRKAGADQTLIASSKRWALMTETPKEKKIDFFYLASRMEQAALDLILVEGFKNEPIPKIQLFRQSAGQKLEDFALDTQTIAVISDVYMPQLPVAQFTFSQERKITAFIQNWLISGHQ